MEIFAEPRRHRGVSYTVMLDDDARSLSPSARLSSPIDGIGEETFELTPSKPVRYFCVCVCVLVRFYSGQSRFSAACPLSHQHYPRSKPTNQSHKARK